MSSLLTYGGFKSLAAQTLTSSAEVGYLVPASGVYPSLPNPTQVAANILTIGANAGAVTGDSLDYGRPFRVRVNGQLNFAQSENFTMKLYQVTAAKNTGFTATNTGTNISTTGAVATGAALKSNFMLDTVLIWDSVSKTLNGYYFSQVFNATFGAITKITQVTALAETDLNFYVTFTAGTATGDTVGPLDFVIENV